MLVKYTGYKSESMTLDIIAGQYPKFVAYCGMEYHGYIHTDKSLIRIIAEKVHYPINLHNLSHKTGTNHWIPARRDDELNGLLNHIEENPEIPLMREL